MLSPVKNKKEIIVRLKSNKGQIEAFGVEQLFLFGSFIHGLPTKMSDVDLLVDFLPGKKTIDNLLGLSNFLHELFGRKVELVTKKSLSPYIGKHILKTAEHVPLSE